MQAAGLEALMQLRAAFVDDDVCPLCLDDLDRDGQCESCEYDSWEDRCDGGD